MASLSLTPNDLLSIVAKIDCNNGRAILFSLMACRCIVATSSPIDILVRPAGSGNTTNYDRGLSFCRSGTSCVEQTSSVLHRLNIFWHL